MRSMRIKKHGLAKAAGVNLLAVAAMAAIMGAAIAISALAGNERAAAPCDMQTELPLIF